MIIAIDGPAGSGKSTVAKLTAKKLGFLHIDTGAMYRALTLKAIDQKKDAANSRSIAMLARKTAIDLKYSPEGNLVVLLDGVDVSAAIRQPRVTKVVSDIAKIGPVRSVMVEMQRKLGHKKDCVLEGRDIGTVVFPKADRKFYLDAAFDERVNRRYKELIKAGTTGVTLESVARDLSNRDKIDSTRKIAPLRPAKDAIIIDTTKLTINQVVKTILNHTDTNG